MKQFFKKSVSVLIVAMLVLCCAFGVSAKDYKSQTPDTSTTYTMKYQKPSTGSTLTYILDELDPSEFISAKEGMAIKLWVYVEDPQKITNSIYLEASSDATGYQESTMSFKGASVRWLLNRTKGFQYLKKGEWSEIEFILHNSANLSKSLGDAKSMSFSPVYQFYCGSSMDGNIDWSSIKRLRLCYDGPSNNVRIAGNRLSDSIRLLDTPSKVEEIKKPTASTPALIGGGVNDINKDKGNTSSNKTASNVSSNTVSKAPANTLSEKSDTADKEEDVSSEKPEENENVSSAPEKSESNTLLIVGIIVGALVLLAVAAAVAVIIIKKKKTK